MPGNPLEIQQSQFWWSSLRGSGRWPAGRFFWFFSQLRGERRTADPAELLFSRQQNGAGRGRSGLYVPAGWLEGLSRMGLASGGSGRPVLGGAGTGARRGRRAPLFGL